MGGSPIIGKARGFTAGFFCMGAVLKRDYCNVMRRVRAAWPGLSRVSR
jgi:hypothetical protein